MATYRKKTARREWINVDDFTCSICREILKDPMRLPCSHIFCSNCLDLVIEENRMNKNQAQLLCPYCRKSFNTSSMKAAVEIQRRINVSSGRCKNCNEEVLLSKMRNHSHTCNGDTVINGACKAMRSADLRSSNEDTSTKDGSINIAGYAVARNPEGIIPEVKSLFDCPCCFVHGLARESLLAHVQARHRQANIKVVCPICAAMPWGDPNQKSQDFYHHIKLRHQFDYEVFMDMQSNEDEVLKKVLTTSMYDTSMAKNR